MASRLALVGCKEAAEGPWTIAKGNESRLEIFGLGQGECVRLEMETPSGPSVAEFSIAGTHFWPSEIPTRYRVCKIGSGTPTTVRVMLKH